MENAKIHEGLAELDGGTDLAVQLASFLEVAASEVVVSGLEVVVDLDVVDEHTFMFDFDFLTPGVEEGGANVLELGDVGVFNNLALLNSGGYLGHEIAELFDASFNLALVATMPVMLVIAILKVLGNLVHCGYEGVPIPDASLNVILVLRPKSAFDNTVN